VSVLAFDLGANANHNLPPIPRGGPRVRLDPAVPAPPSFLTNLGLSKADRQSIWRALQPEARVATLLAGRALDAKQHIQPYVYPPSPPPLKGRTAFAVTAYMNFDGLQGAARPASDATANQPNSWAPTVTLDIDLVAPVRGLNLAGHVAASYNEKMARDDGFDFYA